MKKTEKKSNNGNKEKKPKIMNSFLISNFISSCPYKAQKIIYYYSYIIPVNNFAERRNKSNLVYFYNCPKFKTEDRAKIDTNLSSSIKLTNFISLTKPFYIINLSWLILLTSYFMKSKLARKIPMFVVCPFKNKRNFINKWRFCSFFTLFKVEKILIYYPIFDTSLLNRFFLSKA